MEKPSELAKWFFLFLQTKSAVLMRIEFLVVVIAFLYQLMFFLDQWRRRSRSSTIKYILLILDAIADSTFLYTMGLMQNAPFKIDLFPVWALVLVNLRFSGSFISAYGMPDQENRRTADLSNVIALLGLAFLNGTRNSQFKHPIWALWALQLVRSMYLIFAYVAALRSSLHGRSSVFLTAGMWASDHANVPEANLTTMEGYNYPVYGDQKQKIEVKAPKYNFDLNITDQTVLITVETIWRPDETLSNLSSRADDVELMKDLCLSFSLYRMLRCRFDDLPLSNDRVEKTRKLLCKIMKDEDSRKRTFRIVESELAFLIDYFYTRYPVIFCSGFPLWAILHPILTIAFTCWLGWDIHRIYKPGVGETAHVIHGVNVDLIITWAFMVIIVLKEVCKVLTYVLSDWTKVMVLCEYVARNSVQLPKWLMKKTIVSLLCTPRLRTVQRWHRKIDQYEFLQSYLYHPWPWNLLSLGMIPKRADGVKLGKAIQLPEVVKAAVLKTLCSLDLKEGCLKGDEIPSLKENLVGSQFEWAFKLPTCAHTILVWHIATSLCEIELAQHYNTSLTDCEVLRGLKAAYNCFSSQPYIIKVRRLERVLRANYTVANSISRYCAYLLTSVPDLLPDSYFVPELIFQSTIGEASKILDGCDTLQSIYRRLMREGEERLDNNADDNPIDDGQGHKCSNLPCTSCFLSFMKTKVLRCFCSGKESTQDENGENSNRRQLGEQRQPSTAHSIINVGGGEHNNQSGGNDDNMDTVHHDKIVKMGARLGRSLIETIRDDVARWELLAEVWAHLLVHMAPSWKTEAHKRCLATGGEFITHIWAILCHCGVESSNLWPQQEIPEDGHAANRPEATGGNQDPARQRAAASAGQMLAPGETALQLRSRSARVTDQGKASTSSSVHPQ